MNETSIKALIHARGATLTLIAEKAGVSLSTVSLVVKGKTKSRRIANAIALIVQKPVDQLWPGKYPEKYSRKPPAQVEREVAAAFRTLQNHARTA